MQTHGRMIALIRCMEMSSNRDLIKPAPKRQGISIRNEVLIKIVTYTSIITLILVSSLFCYYFAPILESQFKELYFLVVFVYFIGFGIFIKGKRILLNEINVKIAKEVDKNSNRLNFFLKCK